MVTIQDNILRILRYYNLEDEITIIKVESDRVHAWARNGKLKKLVVENKWTKDKAFITAKYHGDGESYREPGAVHPALQIVFHNYGTAIEWLEMDFDFYNPKGGDLVSLFGHVGEVLYNKLLKRMTSQQKVSQLLDKRFA